MKLLSSMAVEQKSALRQNGGFNGIFIDSVVVVVMQLGSGPSQRVRSDSHGNTTPRCALINRTNGSRWITVTRCATIRLWSTSHRCSIRSTTESIPPNRCGRSGQPIRPKRIIRLTLKSVASSHVHPHVPSTKVNSIRATNVAVARRSTT